MKTIFELRQEDINNLNKEDNNVNYYPSIYQISEIDLSQQVLNTPKMKVQLIAQYRQATGAGLAEAKAVVDEFFVSDSVSGQFKTYVPPVLALKQEWFARINNAGSKIEAIKIYREATNMGLAEANAAVNKYYDKVFATVRPGDMRAKKITASYYILAMLRYDGDVHVVVKKESQQQTEEAQKANRRFLDENKVKLFLRNVNTWHNVIDICAVNTCLYAVTADGRILVASLKDDYSHLTAGWYNIKTALKVEQVKGQLGEKVCFTDRSHNHICIYKNERIISNDFSLIKRNKDILESVCLIGFTGNNTQFFFSHRKSTFLGKSVYDVIDYSKFNEQDIVKLIETTHTVITLKKNGTLTCYPCPREFLKEFPLVDKMVCEIKEIENWIEITDVDWDVRTQFIIALNNKRQLLCTANCPWKAQLETWKNVQSVAINRDDKTELGEPTTKIAAITETGRVLSVGNEQQSKVIDTWPDIKQVVFYDGHVYGLTNDGAVYKA